VALCDGLGVEVDLGIDPEAADDPSNRIPSHFDETFFVLGELAGLDLGCRHGELNFLS
jgi:hypothetical protein